MTIVLKQKRIGSYYICLEEFINYKGGLSYEVAIHEEVGDLLYHYRGSLITNDKTAANNRYYYYCRKAKEEN